MISMNHLVLMILSALITIFLINIISPYAERMGLMDIPSGRKKHQSKTPMIGGISMVISYLLCIPWLAAKPVYMEIFFLSVFIICITGFLDDRHDLSTKKRFMIQIIVALMLAYSGGVMVENLGNLLGFGVIHTGFLGITFTVICFVGLMNAINMADGLDGLTGSLVLVSCGWYAILASMTGSDVTLGLILLLISVLAGFLVFNLRTPWRNRAAVFMGDAGSVTLGLLMTYFAVEIAGHRSSQVTPITVVWVLALPLIDMACVMFRRIRKGKSPFCADNEHLHHIFQHAGFSVGQTVTLLTLVHALLGAFGIIAWVFHVPEYIMFYSFIALLATYYVTMNHAWKVMKALSRLNLEKQEANTRLPESVNGDILQADKNSV